MDLQNVYCHMVLPTPGHLALAKNDQWGHIISSQPQSSSKIKWYFVPIKLKQAGR